MASSEPSKPPSDIGQSPCNKCRYTYSSSDMYDVSCCPYNVCLECRALEDVDAQILDLHKLMIGLSNQRHELKRRINLRHDCLTSKLPLEMVSHIFTLVVVDEPYDYDSRDYPGEYDLSQKLMDPAVRLGAVCKRWREITIGTPQLWTELVITEHNLEQPCYPSVLSQRLHRAGALPLSLHFDVGCYAGDFPILPYSNIVPLLRSQVQRWNHLTFRVSLPVTMLNALLAGLEERLFLDTLALELVKSLEQRQPQISIKYPISPKCLAIEHVSLQQIPIQCDRLTDLTADKISIDDLVRVFRQARNLRYCLLENVQRDAGHYPLADSPVTNVSMRQLKTVYQRRAELTHSTLLRHLTLPSLETFNYKVAQEHPLAAEFEEEIEQLGNFLDRSQPPLHDFSFHLDIQVPAQFRGDWYRVLSSVTSLSLDVLERDRWDDPDSDGEKMQDTLERLGAHVEPIALPRLREMKIYGETMNACSWKALAAIFPDYENNKETPPVARRPLKDVKINLIMTLDFDQEIMPEVIYSRLRAIQKSGVALQVFDGEGDDILGPEVSLTFV